jgi:hypothetical protein
MMTSRARRAPGCDWEKKSMRGVMVAYKVVIDLLHVGLTWHGVPNTPKVGRLGIPLSLFQ